MFRPQYDRIDAKVWCFSKESRSACFPVYQHFRKKKRAPGEIWGRSPPPGGLGGLPPLGSFWPLAFLTLFTSFENFKFFLRRARCSVWSLPLRGLFGPLTLFTLFTSFENFKFFLRRARAARGPLLSGQQKVGKDWPKRAAPPLGFPLAVALARPAAAIRARERRNSSPRFGWSFRADLRRVWL